ncbi:DUF6326 family protein [Zhouia spongiae]|uniref:DUF6326 family protein n=1 Tax=Zhouia spongiae TaxID=2202721 RepID=A0ABY3YNJ0_9FLAO|nr:DUF6326 family protein [Zhouia spongiae]UNY99223.1 DUF6326 family protein [Zhouia spongiae]
MKNIKVSTEVKLSTLWVLVMLNMVFADIFSIIVELISNDVLNIPGNVRSMMAIAAILTNLPIIMIFLSRVLSYKFNRIFNILVGVFTIIYIIGGGSTLVHYLIIASIEIALLFVIIITAFRWKDPAQAIYD